MPPLRDRKVDIPLLVTALLTKHADSMRPIETIGQAFWRSVMSRDWPGNVRELENFVARCIALGSGPTLRDEDGCLISGETFRIKHSVLGSCPAAHERGRIMPPPQALALRCRLGG